MVTITESAAQKVKQVLRKVKEIIGFHKAYIACGGRFSA